MPSEEWIEDHIFHGPTYGAMRIHGHRELPNKVYLCKTTAYPGTLDMIAFPERKNEIIEYYSVFSGNNGQENKPPEIECGELRLIDFDGEEAWWYRFVEERDAVMYAKRRGHELFPKKRRTTGRAV